MTQRVTFDELYRRSTQYRKWSFTRDELQQRRKTINEKGSLKVDERLKETPDVEPSQIEKVTVDEEQKLISFHSRRIIMLAKKFYLVNSVMEYHPKLVLLTCLFLAAKSENFFISIASFSKRIPKTTPESILSLEFEILQSLQFTLFVHHPFRPLYGFFFDIQEALKGEVTAKELGKVYDNARNLINEAIISDAVYYYTPPQIALACFREVDEGLTMKYLEKKFKKEKSEVKEEDIEVNEEPQEKAEGDESKPKQENISDHYDILIKTITQCQEVIRTAQDPTKEEATVIDKKVQYCLNPSIVLKRKREGETPDANDPNKRQRTESVEPTKTIKFKEYHNMAYVQSKVVKKRLQEKRRVSGASLLRDELNNDSGNDSLLDGLPAFQQNKGVMMANFEEWIKMATDNKINTTNSWNFALIDYFHDLNVLREKDNNINFQKASATLDGCVKIYSSRVDSVATETGRLLSGLAARKQMEAEKAKEAAIEEGDEEDGDDTNAEYEDGDQQQTKKKKSRASKTKELTDTLTLAEFDEGGAKSLLLNTLNMDNHTRVVFDATTGDQQQEDKNEEDERDEHEERDIEMSGMDEEDIDISVFKDFIFQDESDMDSLLLCPSFGHLESVLKDVKKAKSILNDVNQQNISIPGDDEHTNAGPGNNDMDFDFDFGGDYDDDGSFVANVVDHDLMAYFDHTLKRNWAGPEHWKVKQLKKDKAQQLQPLLNGTDKKRKPKEEFKIDFMEDMDEDEEEKLFAKSKVATTLSAEQQESTDSHLLPDDLYFSSEQLVRLFLKPDQKLKIFQKKGQIR
ncbi:unnamed protein product [Wickerhamomyces anomalus]